MNVLNLDTDKLYKYAYKIAKQEGKELLHHCLAKVDLSKAKDPYTYLYTIMRNEFINRKSEYNKFKHSQEILYYSPETVDRYDVNILYTILHQLELEGMKKEVELFKEVRFTSNISKVAIKRNISRHRIRLTLKKVTDEIIKHYPAV
jgi:DNA-directed RNA polymerase specialized sigma24 family protein